MALHGRYEYEKHVDGKTYYSCKIMNQKILNCGLVVYGTHDDWKSHIDVKLVKFTGCSMHQIPKGLTRCFPFVEDLTILGSKIKSITKDDLAGYKYLKRISISDSQIEFLPGDLFKDLKSIEEISFEWGYLKIVEPNILDGLNNLKYVRFLDDFHYTKKYSIYPVDKSTTTLAEVKFELKKVFEYYNKIMKRQQDTEKFVAKTTVETQTDKPKYHESKKDISYCIKNHIKDDRFKDFKISIGDREFHVHKFVLAARSPTLAEVLLSNPEVENLNLFDIPVDIFEMILNYMYNDELPKIETLDVLRLYAVAGRLKIEELLDFAAMEMINKINEQNAIDVLKLSRKFDHAELKQKAYEMIKAEYPKVQFKDSWADKPDYVEKVIQKFKQKEEVMKKIEEKFQNELMESD